jgi:hypothetical protein
MRHSLLPAALLACVGLSACDDDADPGVTVWASRSPDDVTGVRFYDPELNLVSFHELTGRDDTAFERMASGGSVGVVHSLSSPPGGSGGGARFTFRKWVDGVQPGDDLDFRNDLAGIPVGCSRREITDITLEVATISWDDPRAALVDARIIEVLDRSLFPPVYTDGSSYVDGSTATTFDGVGGLNPEFSVTVVECDTLGYDDIREVIAGTIGG